MPTVLVVALVVAAVVASLWLLLLLKRRVEREVAAMFRPIELELAMMQRLVKELQAQTRRAGRTRPPEG